MKVNSLPHSSPINQCVPGPPRRGAGRFCNSSVCTKESVTVTVTVVKSEYSTGDRDRVIEESFRFLHPTSVLCLFHRRWWDQTQTQDDLLETETLGAQRVTHTAMHDSFRHPNDCCVSDRL
jgi:hypothetical protein